MDINEARENIEQVKAHFKKQSPLNVNISRLADVACGEYLALFSSELDLINDVFSRTYSEVTRRYGNRSRDQAIDDVCLFYTLFTFSMRRDFLKDDANEGALRRVDLAGGIDNLNQGYTDALTPSEFAAVYSIGAFHYLDAARNHSNSFSTPEDRGGRVASLVTVPIFVAKASELVYRVAAFQGSEADQEAMMTLLKKASNAQYKPLRAVKDKVFHAYDSREDRSKTVSWFANKIHNNVVQWSRDEDFKAFVMASTKDAQLRKIRDWVYAYNKEKKDTQA